MDNALAWLAFLVVFLFVLAGCGAIADWLDNLPRNDIRRRRPWTPDERDQQGRWNRIQGR